ncbi:MAG TPA: gamma-glutamylcyclotransferase family protein [Candidatus Obscuribacterales bacterium]
MIQIFVYGTLKPGEAYFSTFCEPYVTAAVPAIAQGDLWHLPQGYPAMTAGDRWVTGTLLTLGDEAAIAPLDEFEDYDPARPAPENQYVRHLRPVFDLAHHPQGEAWLYLMARDRVQQYQGILIPAGVWSRQQWPSIAPTAPPEIA